MFLNIKHKNYMIRLHIKQLTFLSLLRKNLRTLMKKQKQKHQVRPLLKNQTRQNYKSKSVKTSFIVMTCFLQKLQNMTTRQQERNKPSTQHMKKPSAVKETSRVQVKKFKKKNDKTVDKAYGCYQGEGCQN